MSNHGITIEIMNSNKRNCQDPSGVKKERIHLTE